MTARHRPGKVPKVPKICRAIRIARETEGLSQRELAVGVDAAQSMVARWETSSEPTLAVIGKMERVLGLPKGDLLRSAGYVAGVISVGRAIREDPILDQRAKSVLLASYRALTRRVASNGRSKVS
jgi:transcriptional regulator with XRE-family HTH domain